MSVLYILLAPLFFYALSNRLNLLHLSIKGRDNDKIKINVFFLSLIIIIQVIVILAIEFIK